MTDRTTDWPEAWYGLLHDHGAPTDEHTDEDPGSPAHPLVGALAVADEALPRFGSATGNGPDLPVVIVATGGAGALAGPLRYASRHRVPVAGLQVALRDPGDLAGNARRVVAAWDAAYDDEAIDADLLDDLVPAVEIPASPGDSPGAGWLSAADVFAEAGFALLLRVGGGQPDRSPSSALLAAQLTAALDRELPYACVGVRRAVSDLPSAGPSPYGAANLLLATRASLDGSGAAEVAETLERSEVAQVAADLRELSVASTRRWCTSLGSDQVTELCDRLAGVFEVAGSGGSGEPTRD